MIIKIPIHAEKIDKLNAEIMLITGAKIENR